MMNSNYLPQTTSEFFDSCWEQGPCLFKASDSPERQKFFQGLMDFRSFAKLAQNRESSEDEPPMQFGMDVNAARYVNGKRETPNGEVCEQRRP